MNSRDMNCAADWPLELKSSANLMKHSTCARLRSAIERIEADLGGNPAEREHCGANLVTAVVDSSVEIIPPAGHGPLPPQSQYAFSPERASRKASSAIWSVLPLVGAAILGVATYVAVERGVREQSKLQSDQNIRQKYITSICRFTVARSVRRLCGRRRTADRA